MSSLKRKIQEANDSIDSLTREWEHDFIRDIYDKTNGGTNVDNLTENQIDKLEEIWAKMFA